MRIYEIIQLTDNLMSTKALHLGLLNPISQTVKKVYNPLRAFFARKAVDEFFSVEPMIYDAYMSGMLFMVILDQMKFLPQSMKDRLAQFNAHIKMASGKWADPLLGQNSDALATTLTKEYSSILNEYLTLKKLQWTDPLYVLLQNVKQDLSHSNDHSSESQLSNVVKSDDDDIADDFDSRSDEFASVGARAIKKGTIRRIRDYTSSVILDNNSLSVSSTLKPRGGFTHGF